MSHARWDSGRGVPWPAQAAGRGLGPGRVPDRTCALCEVCALRRIGHPRLWYPDEGSVGTFSPGVQLSCVDIQPC